jgi:hypothetical protein
MKLFARGVVTAVVVAAAGGFGVATAGDASAAPLCYFVVLLGVTGTVSSTPVCVPYPLATLCEDTTVGAPAVETARLYVCVPAP